MIAIGIDFGQYDCAPDVQGHGGPEVVISAAAIVRTDNLSGCVSGEETAEHSADHQQLS